MKFFVRKIPRFAKLQNLDFENLFFFAIFGGFVGARLFYILFYNFEFFAQNPAQIFAIYRGGLSVHGGICGGVFGIYFFARKFRENCWQILDFATPFLALGLSFGRIGNFINGELFGRAIFNFPFACDFGDGVVRFPVQILGSAKNFAIFAILFALFFSRRKFFEGFFAAVFLILLGASRFFIEFLREPDAQLGFIFWKITAGQIFAAMTFALGIFLLFRRKNYSKKIKSRRASQKKILENFNEDFQ